MPRVPGVAPVRLPVDVATRAAAAVARSARSQEDGRLAHPDRRRAAREMAVVLTFTADGDGTIVSAYRVGWIDIPFFWWFFRPLTLIAGRRACTHALATLRHELGDGPRPRLRLTSSACRTWRSATSRPHCSQPPPPRSPLRRSVLRCSASSATRSATRSARQTRRSPPPWPSPGWARSSRSSRPRWPTGAAAAAPSSSGSSARPRRARSRRLHRPSSSSRSPKCSNAPSSSPPPSSRASRRSRRHRKAHRVLGVDARAGRRLRFFVLGRHFAPGRSRYRSVATPVRGRRRMHLLRPRDRPPSCRNKPVRGAHRAAHDARGRVREILDARYKRRFALLATIGFLTGLFNAPSSQLMNKYLSDVRDFSNSGIALFRTVTTGVPGLIGLVIGGRLAERYGASRLPSLRCSSPSRPRWCSSSTADR